MSRSEYGECETDWALIKYRGQVASATRGKRGQKFLRELLKALDEMPEKRLIDSELKTARGEVCAIGALMDRCGELEDGPVDWPWVPALASKLDIAEQLLREIVFMNDEYAFREESPESRWCRMRAWVARQIKGG